MSHLSTTQTTTLRSAILADQTAAAMYATGNLTGLAAWLNALATPDFYYWRPNVGVDEMENAWVGTDIDGMSALNMQRLQLQLLLTTSRSGVFDMSRADRRAGFENPFGTNQSNASRVAMRALWKRKATRFEKLFATGTGSDASPAVLGLDDSGQYLQGAVPYTELEGL